MLAASAAVILATGCEVPPAEEEPEVHLRRVLLPVRPIDLQALFQSGRPDEDAGCETDGMTVGACLADPENRQAYAELLEDDPQLAAEVQEILDECFEDHSQLFAGIKLVGCQ
jgi:hypothetical protein